MLMMKMSHQKFFSYTFLNFCIRAMGKGWNLEIWLLILLTDLLSHKRHTRIKGINIILRKSFFLVVVFESIYLVFYRGKSFIICVFVLTKFYSAWDFLFDLLFLSIICSFKWYLSRYIALLNGILKISYCFLSLHSFYL